MPITHITKRNKSVEEFDPKKITIAIAHAMNAVGTGSKDDAKAVTELVIQELDKNSRLVNLHKIPMIRHSFRV